MEFILMIEILLIILLLIGIASLFFQFKNKPTNNKESLRMSTGFGFNLNTPIGPLSLTYAIPIQSESYDKERKFVFSIGWVN